MQWILQLLLIQALFNFSPALAAVPISSARHNFNRHIVPNRFIIEVDVLATIPTKRSYTRALDAVYDLIKSRDVEFEVDKEYDSQGLFVGAALTINTTPDAVVLEEIPGLKAIYPVTRIERPRVLDPRVVSGPTDPGIIPSTTSTHVATGVDKVHARGFSGRGIKIAILDTGIDYTHPALGGAIGPGNKVIGGYDFVGDDYFGDGGPPPAPDNDPLDQCEGHGTFVAGVLGANPDNAYGVKGVAYEASISAYRIFGCTGATTDDIVVEAMLRAVADGHDILNLSFAGAAGWTSHITAVLASRIARRGKIVTIAAGNDGLSGSWYSATPGNAIDAISVGSTENTAVPVRQAIVNGVSHPPIPCSSFTKLDISGERPIYAFTEDTTAPDDACSTLPDDTPNLSQFIVIIRRGGCTFVEKIFNAIEKGATAALIYDNGGIFTDVVVPGFPAALISAEDGQFLVESFFSGIDVRLSFPDTPIGNVPNTRDGGLMSPGSTYGPTNDFHFKPAVSAPGGNILGLVPIPRGGFAIQSGTSFAAPFVAGAAALLLQARGKTAATARAARELFETTAVRVPSSLEESSFPQTLTQQGAGLVNVYDALFSKTSVSPGELILNDTANFKRRQTFTVTNNDRKIKSYRISHLPAGTALTVQPDSIFAAFGPVPQVDAPASVTLTPTQFTLRPGQSRTVTAVFTPPSGLDASQYPVYSGFLQVAGPGENLHVSYLGLVGSLKDKRVTDTTDFYFGERLPGIIDATGALQVNPTNYTFVDNDWPVFLSRMAFGSPLIRLDLVEPNIRVQTTLNARGPRDRGHFFSFPHRSGGGSFARVKIVGPLLEVGFVTRHNFENNAFNNLFLSEPRFANGSQIPSGSYRLLWRALKVTGDRSKHEDYETWLSPIVGIFP